MSHRVVEPMSATDIEQRRNERRERIAKELQEKKNRAKSVFRGTSFRSELSGDFADTVVSAFDVLELAVNLEEDDCADAFNNRAELPKVSVDGLVRAALAIIISKQNCIEAIKKWVSDNVTNCPCASFDKSDKRIACFMSLLMGTIYDLVNECVGDLKINRTRPGDERFVAQFLLTTDVKDAFKKLVDDFYNTAVKN